MEHLTKNLFEYNNDPYRTLDERKKIWWNSRLDRTAYTYKKFKKMIYLNIQSIEIFLDYHEGCLKLKDVIYVYILPIKSSVASAVFFFFNFQFLKKF